MVTTSSYDIPPKYVDDQGSSTLNPRLRVFEDYLSSSTIRPKESQLFQDEYSSATDLNVFKKLLAENPLTDIENQIIDTLNIEDGEDMNSDQYRDSLFRIITRYDSLAIMVISSLLDSQRIKFLQASELLSYLGKIRHLPTYHHRTWLLVKNLTAISKYVRDGASLGLFYLENPATIQSLKMAINREPSKQLRSNMIQVLNGLERKINASSVKENSY